MAKNESRTSFSLFKFTFAGIILTKDLENCSQLRPRWITFSLICIILHILLGSFNNCFIILSNISKFLTRSPLCRLSSKLRHISRHGFTINRCVSCRYPQKVDPSSYLSSYSCISSVQFQAQIKLFRHRIAVNAIFFQFPVAQAASFPGQYTTEQPRFRENIPSKRW